MATVSNTALQISNIDFNDIRDSLKTYLESQEYFQDYNFEGSGLTILLDILAYNTHFNAYYLNMVANEMFLDSAILRNSVVSRAKELGYTPRSVRGAEATVTLTITPDDSPASITVPKHTKFTTTIDNDSYTFVTKQAYTVEPVNGSYTKTNIVLVEGEPITHTFVVNTSNPERYIIPNANADTSELTVQVQTSNTDSTSYVYTLATDLTEANSSSRIYWLQETEDAKFEVEFGDGTIGKALENGNLVKLTYLVSNATVGNGANTFSLVDSISGYANASVTTTSSASGGQDIESIESIKFNAPKNYEIQGRTVTEKDYERYILANYPSIAAVNVWGGEDNTTPVYGKVFISVKPVVGTVISEATKTEITTDLSSKNVLSIDPVFVDADYIYVVPTVNVVYNPDLTTLTSGEIITNVRTAIGTYETVNLNTFGYPLRYSKFCKAIDDVDASILSNETTLKLQKRIEPTAGTSANYTISFEHRLQDNGNTGDIVSSTFTFAGFTCYLQDDIDGNIDIVRDSTSGTIVVSNDVGTVDYTNGIISLTSFEPTSIDNSGVLKITVKPYSLDIEPQREQILTFADITITTEENRD